MKSKLLRNIYVFHFLWPMHAMLMFFGLLAGGQLSYSAQFLSVLLVKHSSVCLSPAYIVLAVC